MKKYRNIGQIVAFIAIFATFVVVVHQFIIPVLFGLLVSLVFRPVYLWLVRQFGDRRRLAAGISTFLIFCLGLVPLILIGMYVINDVAGLAKIVSTTSTEVNKDARSVHQIEPLDKLYVGVNRIYPMPREKFQQQARIALERLSEAAKTLASGALATIPRAATSLVFFLIAFYFGLVDGPRLAKFIRDNSPFSSRDTDVIFQTTVGICNAVVLGAFLAGLVQGTIIGVAYWILGIPKPLFFGALTALFALIPLVGSAPTGLGGTVYLLVTGKFLKAIFMFAVFCLAAVSDNIIKPMVLKGRMSLHPFLGLLSVLGGIKAFGFAGIFLGPVITALTITLLQLFHHRVKNLRATTQPAAATE